MLVGYYGDPNSRVFGKILYQGEHAEDMARQDRWNGFGVYGVHDDKIETGLDKIWRKTTLEMGAPDMITAFQYQLDFEKEDV